MMKKVLCGMICVAAGASFATITNTVATVDVIAVNSSLSNTVIAVPGLDLATGGALSISNLVKTTNLSEGDRLLAFSDGNYECWTLSSDKIWVKPAQKFTLDGVGDSHIIDPRDASVVTKAVGSGIWLSRKIFNVPIYIYAQHTNTLSTTVEAGKTYLLGNPSPTSKAPEITGCANTDKIHVPTSGRSKVYTYDNAKGGWCTYVGFSSVVTNLPAITAGTGFWYESNGSAPVTVSW